MTAYYRREEYDCDNTCAIFASRFPSVREAMRVHERERADAEGRRYWDRISKKQYIEMKQEGRKVYYGY